tara:strand:+ start:2602 stop:2910 length:309 start_codon:yes stop_codon:yes gene_type:complete
LKIKKDMIVRIVSGNNKGMEGKVLRVFPKKNRAIVEGINFIKKATRPSQSNQSGGIVEKEASVHISNLMVVQSGEATRVSYKILEDGKKVRISSKTKEEIVT